MTAKEKANHIVKRYWVKNKVGQDSFEIAIQNALICVENEYYEKRELLLHLKGSGAITNGNVYLRLIENLIAEEQEVKTEIENL